MLIKQTINSDWNIWKENFIETYAIKGWSHIRYAMSFKYQTGSLVEYAVKKERLLLEIRKEIDTGTLIDLIATGLPNFISDRMDRNSLQNVKELFNEVGKLEYLTDRKKFVEKRGIKTEVRIKKSPCKYCQTNNKGTRFHSEADCWFKPKDTEERKRIEFINNAELEDALKEEAKKLILTPLIKIKVLLNDSLEVNGIYDSGSNISLINSNLINVNKREISNSGKTNLKTINGVSKTDGLIAIKMKIFEIEKKINIIVIDSEYFNYDILIGLDCIKEFNLCQDENLKITQKNIPNRVDKNLIKIEDTNSHENLIVNFNEHVDEGNFKIQVDHLNYKEKDEINNLINKYRATFAKDKYDVGRVKNYEAHIDLLIEKYPSKRPYRCTIEDKKEIEKQVGKLLEKKLIEESYSPFAAPVTLAYKRDEDRKSRLCIDFRDLNKIVVPQAQPFPLIEDLIEKTRDCKYFSSLDINSAFWSIPLKIEDRAKTGFITQEGHFQWTCLPFGLKTSPAIFQRILSNIIRKNNLSSFTVNYIDDILVFSKTFEEPDDDEEEKLQVVNLINIDVIKEDQMKNEKLCIKKNKLIKKGEIYYKKVRNKERIVLSEKLSIEFIKKIHEHYCHVGIKQIKSILNPFYTSEKLAENIKEVCKNCLTCTKNKSRGQSKYGLMSHLGPAKYPFEIISIDTIGGFGGTRSTKKYIHLLVDHFTRYAWISTSKTQNSSDFIKLVEKITDENKIGMALTDQYPGINSREFKEYMKEKEILLVFTASDSPFSNGINERLNQTLVNKIRCKINEEKRKIAWTKIAQECIRIYNDTVHTVTNFTPRYLLEGESTAILPEGLKHYEKPRDLQKDRKIALQNTLRSHNYNKKIFDKNRKYVDFKVGDMVFVENKNKLNRKKLDELRIGPYEILEKISNSIYKINTGHKKTESNLFHITKLIPCLQNEE